jgi:hypothetical protein
VAFRLADYSDLLYALREKGYRLGPVSAYFESAPPPFIFLRHDVDRLSSRAVHMAAAERDLGVKATYYFRCDSRMGFPEENIRFVVELGHEIGFHYETVVRLKDRADEVPDRFRQELAALRAIAQVRTVTAHGSPLSRLSNAGYTKKIDLRELDLIGDPAVNIDFSRVLYITDSGGVYGSPNNLRDWSDDKNLREPTPPLQLSKVLDPRQEPLVVLSSHPERWPFGFVGLLQVRMTDFLVNTLKKLAGSRRAESE